MKEKPFRVVSAKEPDLCLGEFRSLAEAESYARSLKTIIENETKVQVCTVGKRWIDVPRDTIA